jgi:hypothetical protein
MSALGHKRAFRNVQPMSALLPKADTAQHDRDVRYVPEGDIAPHLHRGRIVKTSGVHSLILLLESYG